MKPGALHSRWARAMAALLRDPDPPAALERLRQDPDTEPALLRLLEAVDPAGLQLSAILVARLRFERLERGSARVRQLFDEEPERFSALFRRYHAEVPPLSGDPLAEAEAFSTWLRDRDGR